MEDWEMYSKIQELKKTGLKIAQIARRLNISRNTVYKYVDLSPEEFSQTRENSLTRMKILDDHKEEICSWLMKYNDMSSSQVLDWLAEKYKGIAVSERTVSNYVNHIRVEYNIPKTKNPRDYEAVKDPPPGNQCQVDFGTIKLRDTSNVWRTLNCITFVLSHSRYKYVEWLDRPFTAADVVSAHEHAFEYYGGYTEEIVYDQDHLIVVSENHGDIVYTREFQIYKDFRNFKTWVCRGADPESKGRVENAVKFVKKILQNTGLLFHRRIQ